MFFIFRRFSRHSCCVLWVLHHLSLCYSFFHLPPPPSIRYLYREEECEDGLKEEEEKEEETPVTESDSDEQEGAVSKRTTPRYFRTCWSGDILNDILFFFKFSDNKK